MYSHKDHLSLLFGDYLRGDKVINDEFRGKRSLKRNSTAENIDHRKYFKVNHSNFVVSLTWWASARYEHEEKGNQKLLCVLIFFLINESRVQTEVQYVRFCK